MTPGDALGVREAAGIAGVATPTVVDEDSAVVVAETSARSKTPWCGSRPCSTRVPTYRKST
jgi:hypothetical protein